MSLTHVFMWDSELGFRPTTITEACSLYPNKVSASSRRFICALCYEAVTLTSTTTGERERHFRHDSQTQNRECEDRSAQYNQVFNRPKEKRLPLKLSINGGATSYMLGFAADELDESSKSSSSRFTITTSHGTTFTFSLDRLSASGFTYLPVGEIPSTHFEISLILQDSPAQTRQQFPGINPRGTFFELRSGRMIPSRGHVFTDSTYLFLTTTRLHSVHIAEGLTSELIKTTSDDNKDWFLYRINCDSFTQQAARFFLQHEVFLTNKPTAASCIWPPAISTADIIYFQSDDLFFLAPGKENHLRIEPGPPVFEKQKLPAGTLYHVSGANFNSTVSYTKNYDTIFKLISYEQPKITTPLPQVILQTIERQQLESATYTKIPPDGLLIISSQVYGRIVVLKGDQVTDIIALKANKEVQLSIKTLNTRVQIYLGIDLAREVQFVAPPRDSSAPIDQKMLITRLQQFHTSPVHFSHSQASIVAKLQEYPLVCNWLLKQSRSGTIDRKALQFLRTFINKKKETDNGKV